MLKSIIKPSVLALGILLNLEAKADGFLLPSENFSYQSYEEAAQKETANQDYIIPLIFIKDIEFYNNTSTSAYTKDIKAFLSLEPSVIVADNEAMADYFLIPYLQYSKIEPINQEKSRYSMAVTVKLQASGGAKIDKEEKRRFILIDNAQDKQEIARKLMLKLIKEASTALVIRLKNK
ncbi:MAG: hypothetical protein J6J35_05425 [Alphaproteobacteria bacterium]|nr:hypothetical protein [Alphaproteobacteria bacterium]